MQGLYSKRSAFCESTDLFFLLFGSPSYLELAERVVSALFNMSQQLRKTIVCLQIGPLNNSRDIWLALHRLNREEVVGNCDDGRRSEE